MKSTIVQLATSLIAGAKALETNSTQLEPELLRRATNMTLIPEGTSLNTFPGYWMDGSYSTLATESGTLDFEISLTLHVPSLTADGIYQTWH